MHADSHQLAALLAVVDEGSFEAAADELRVTPSAVSQRIKALERDLARKEKALAEAAALLVLRKNAAAIWGDGEDA